MKNRGEDSCKLVLADGCLEAAPQLIFQLYVLLVQPTDLYGIAGKCDKVEGSPTKTNLHEAVVCP
jgi:hypothetical protein